MKKDFNKQEIELLSDPILSAKELRAIFNVKTDQTIGRWRKQLGIKVPIGSKKGKPRPHQVKVMSYKCVACSALFNDLPYKKRKVCSKKCLSEFFKSIDRSYMQTEDYKIAKRNPNTPAYTRYARQVRKFSELNYVKFQNLINPNNLPRTLCGVEGGYQLDHIMSIKECWNKKVPPEEAAKPENLRLITWQENLNNRKFDPILNHGN